MKFLLLLLSVVSAQFIATTTSGGVVSDNPFTFDILTLIEDDTFTPPLYDGGTYNFNIAWGDASNDDITAWNDGDLTHTYADAGASTYSISITGTLIGWKFNNGGDKLLMQDLTNWGILRFGNTGDTFQGCTNLVITATDAPNLSGITDLSGTFQLCRALTTVPGMGDWDVSAIESFYSMFHTADLFTEDITGWNTSSCTNMGYMFYGADAFNQAIGSWDVSNVTSMTWMFYSNEGFNGDISGWNTGSVSTLASMFNGAILFNQDISGWNLSQATSLSAFLNGATAFEQSLATLNITTITNMTNMFNNVTLDIANYDALLIGWEGQAEQPNVVFGGSEGTYSAGAATTAREALEANGWTITDGGQTP